MVREIRKQEEPQRKKVEEQTASIGSRFFEMVSDAGMSSNAFLPVGEIDLKSDPRALPEGVSIGMLKHPDLDKLFIPAVLPFSGANATGFCVDSSSEASVMNLMQMVALRFMLSVPINLVMCHYVDLHSYGQEAKTFGRIANSIISDRTELEAFIGEMEQLVIRLNRNELLKCETLREYNADSSCIGVPYHFVFVSNIQDIKDSQIISRITKLCQGRVASNCGIYFFYTINKKSFSQQNESVEELMRISELVSRRETGWCFSNTVYGDDFENRYFFELDSVLPSNRDDLVEEVNERHRHVKPQIVSFVNKLNDLIKDGQYWTGDATKDITIPIGRKGANALVSFELAGNTSDYFAMIGGRPGYGKTILLHDIICNGSIIYSPEELQFYLIDCTNGAGFKPYEQLPHAHVVVTTRQREYTDSAIEQLICEMYRRAELFKSVDEKNGIHVEKIDDYRRETGEKLPRILVIIDEFQVLLEKSDRLSHKIGGALEKIVREGRKYGIHIVFCTQSFRSIDFDTELITLRMAFNLKENDSVKVLGNDSAAHLTKKGEAILNNCNGDKNANVFFQAAYIKEDELPQYVDFCIAKCKEHNIEIPRRYVFDGKAVSNIGTNERFIELLTGNGQDPENIITYLGVPLFIRESHSYVALRKDRGANLLICGTDKRAALSTLALVNFQIRQTVDSSDMRMIDYFNDSSPESRYLNQIAGLCDIPYLRKKELTETINAIDELLKQRINDDMAGLYNSNSPIFLTIAFLQNSPDLRNDGYKKSECKAKLENILKNGPDYGIHVIAYAYNYKSLSDTFDRDALSSFGNQVILQYGAAQQEADNLAEGTAVLVAENNVTTYERDPFMPYNECTSGNLRDEILDYIFSIYN
ncbi:MAG: hypothetical protein J5711_01720 [Bacteroidales bacterium]|nr:hypothetical protein [Bacteroidales bacterium]